ncbi:MAG: hypothetical protein KDE56_15080 [Anaerolineales bacterium]|nr:hypothetical protein [Anaerolineales bacterium]
MKENTATLQVYSPQQTNAVANIVLNGYNIRGEGPLGKQGSMRSFTIVSGDLWDQWSDQITLRLQDTTGKSSNIRIAALPVEDDGYGLIEFL